MRISDWSSDVCSSDLRDLAQTQLEQPVAARRLAIIVALRRCLAQYLDLAVVEAEAAVDRQYLRFERPVVGQEYPGRAAFDDRRGNRGRFDVGGPLCGEDDASILLPERLQQFAQLCAIGHARGRDRVSMYG